MTQNILVMFGSTETEASGIAALGINPKAFVIQLVTWIFVFLVLRRFVFVPIVKILDTRRSTIEDGVRLTTEMRQEKEKLDKEVDKIKSQARKHADEVLANAQSQAGIIIKEAEESAQNKIGLLMEDAKQKIEQETERAKRAVEKEAVDLIIRATEAVASEKLDAKKDAVLIDRVLKEQI